MMGKGLIDILLLNSLGPGAKVTALKCLQIDNTSGTESINKTFH